MVPIGRGQRELIIGDRQTGKTAVAVDTIINQKGKGVVCIYVAIGQKQSTVAQVVRTLEEFGAMELHHRGRRHRLRARPPPLHRPLRRLRDGRVLPRQRQARALHLRRPLEARRLLPRDLAAPAPPARAARPTPATSSTCTAGSSSGRPSSTTRRAGARLTALPIIETQAGDLSAYIPTNVISITDGQIFLESDLFNSGIRPAINVGNSVSRVGGSRPGQGDEGGGRAAAPRPRPVPRDGRLRDVRLRPRQVHPGAARPRPADDRDPEAGPVPADAGGEADRDHLRGHQRLPRRAARSPSAGATRRSCYACLDRSQPALLHGRSPRRRTSRASSPRS